MGMSLNVATLQVKASGLHPWGKVLEVGTVGFLSYFRTVRGTPSTGDKEAV